MLLFLMRSKRPWRYPILRELGVQLVCVVAISHSISAADVMRYTGAMTLPVDLFKQTGAKIEKHKYEIEVVKGGNVWTLSFLQEGKDRITVKGKLAAGDPFNLPAMTPLVGTHYMRSSAEPLKTAQERQFSKSGLPQYAEQERDWKATLRVYQSHSEPGEVLFVFQVQNAGGQPDRVDFKLRSAGP